jgi:DNA-binding IclR family transcriptional regulator
MGDRGVKVALNVGDRAPLHRVSSGKAILAELSDSYIDQYISKFKRVDGAEGFDEAELRVQLDRTRERGYSKSFQEYEGELVGIGTAVRDANESVIGAIAISGPPHRLQGKRLSEDLPELLTGTSREITLNLQYAE